MAVEAPKPGATPEPKPGEVARITQAQNEADQLQGVYLRDWRSLRQARYGY